MNKIKKITAGCLALSMIFALSACNSDKENNTTEEITTTAKTEWTGDNIEVTADDGVLDQSADISGKVLKWMGIYDINPTNSSPERSAELALFEDTYGASIEWMVTNSAQMYDDLAVSITGGTPPDIFTYDWIAVPNCVTKGMYQPIDSLIDWTDPMWAEVKDLADKFIWEGEHYVAPLGYAFNDNQILMYNKTLVETEGFNDPYELYLEDKWDWDAFTGMMKEFVETNPDNYGIGGWWANAVVFTTGETIVTYDGEKFHNNIYSGAIERAQDVITDLFKNDIIKRGWIDPSQAFTSNDLLFYGMGTWAYNAASESMPSDTIQIVPFPKAPNTDKFYISNKMHSYMWVKGSENGDVVKAWLDCSRLVNSDSKYTSVAKEKFLENSKGWTSEMYDTVMEFYNPDKFIQSNDYGYSLSTFMCNEVMPVLYAGIVDERFENWVQAREEFSTIVESEIEVYN